MDVLSTDRLLLRPFVLEDAAFIVQLLNEPSFIQYIADKGVRTPEQAEDYLKGGPLQSYAVNGHGLYAVTLKDSLEPIGMCGLIRRDPAQDLDLGYAFLPAFWSRGYALESCQAMLTFGRKRLGLERTLARVSPDNAASIALLRKLGFVPCPPPRGLAEEADTVYYLRG